MSQNASTLYFLLTGLVLMSLMPIALAATFTIEEVDSGFTLPLSITSFSPATPIIQSIDAANTFTAATSQEVTSQWFLDTVLQPETSQAFAKTWSSGDLGAHNVTYAGSNENGSVSQEWAVTVSDNPEIIPQVEDTAPEGNGGGGGGGGGEVTVTYATQAKIINYPREIKISPNGVLDITLTVKNTGDAALDSVLLEISNDWFSFDKNAFSLAADETKEIPIKLTIPASANVGPYSVTMSLKGYDTISFVMTVTNTEGTASIATIDVEVIRKGIEDVKRRVQLFKGQGYNTTDAEDFAAKAEASFKEGNVLSSSDYITFANDALDKIEKTTETKTFLLSYILAGVIVVLLVLLYYFYQKYRSEVGNTEEHSVKKKEPDSNKTAGNKKEVEVSVAEPKEKPQETPARKEQPKSFLEEDVKVDDMIKKLEEIRKRVNK